MTLVALTLCLLAFVTLVAAFLTASMLLAILCIVLAVLGSCVLVWDIVAKRKKHRALRDALAAAGTMLAEGTTEPGETDSADLTSRAVALIHEHPDVEFTQEDFVEYGLVEDPATTVQATEGGEEARQQSAPLFSEGEVDFTSQSNSSDEVSVLVPGYAPDVDTFAPAEKMSFDEVLAEENNSLTLVEDVDGAAGHDGVSGSVSTSEDGPEPEHKSAS